MNINAQAERQLCPEPMIVVMPFDHTNLPISMAACILPPLGKSNINRMPYIRSGLHLALWSAISARMGPRPDRYAAVSRRRLRRPLDGKHSAELRYKKP